ncbi:MAG: TRAP transporter small permease [Deltaproteobacteria bacterium]|nr:MAG: TRAP transporter small permease [Deltaproteobacteria bacterium]
MPNSIEDGPNIALTAPLRRAVGLLNTITLWLGVGVVIATMLVVVANMLLRPFQYPIQGTFELMGFGGAIITAFALGYSQERNSHIAVTIIFDLMGPKAKLFADATGKLLCFAFFGFTAYKLTLLGLNLRATGEVSETLRFVTYPVAFCVALGFLSLTLSLLLDALDDLAALIEGR